MGEYFVVRRGATALRNEVVFDERISYAALGILARALASPEGANLGYRAFVGRGLGEKAVRAAMRELEAVGYRFRFTLRKSSGRVRTLTIFSDEPMTPQQARVVALEQSQGDYLLEGAASPEPELADEGERLRRSHRAATGAARSDGRASHRAATGAARCDQGKQGKTAGRTVPRSTAARSSAALSLRDTKSSKEDLTQPHPHPPQRSTSLTSPGEGQGSVGSGNGCADEAVVEGEAVSPVTTAAPQAACKATQKPPRSAKGPAAMPGGDRGAESASEADLAIFVACVPESMRVMDARGLGLVVGLLRERLDAGWAPGEIKRLLDSPLPDRVARMSGLVASRLRRLVAVGESPRAQAAAASRERERLARERAAVVDAREAQTAPSVLHMRIHDMAKELAPGLSPARSARVELAVRQALADAWHRENPQGGKPSLSALLEVLAASGEQIAGRVVAEHVGGEVA